MPLLHYHVLIHSGGGDTPSEVDVLIATRVQTEPTESITVLKARQINIAKLSGRCSCKLVAGLDLHCVK